MATFMIKPIKMITIGGFKAKITGINTDPNDCFSGTITAKGIGTIDVEWNKNGIARDQSSSCNLKTKSSEFQDAKEALKVIR